MCLILNKHERHSEPRITDVDICCYKVILDNRSCKYDYFDDEGLFTPFQKEQIEIGSTYTSEFSFTSLGNIDEGLHSLINLNDCYGLIKRMYNPDFLIVCKCLIPAGSRYYEGVFGGYDCLASDRLTYLEIL